MQSHPAIAVLIATRNRARALERSLASVMRQTLATESFEVLVVDNASTDDTRPVVERFLHGDEASLREAGRGPLVRYCFEAKVGVSHARNRALTDTDAPLVAFIDDDAWAEPAWLQVLLDAFVMERRENPTRPVCIGGPVALDWEGPQPDWLPGWGLHALGLREYGKSARELDFPREQVIGSNMAFERDFLRRIGGFDARLGRKGRGLIGNEETAALRRLAEQGGRILYEPRATVHHRVVRERATIGWFLRRVYDQGRTEVIEMMGSPGDPDVFPPPPMRLRGSFARLVKRRDRKAAVSLLMALANDAGVLRQRAAFRVGRGERGL